MKRILALFLSLVVAGEMQAAPKEKHEGRRGAKVSAGASGVATQRGVTMRAQPQAVRSSSGGERTRMSVATNRADSTTQSVRAPSRISSTQQRTYREPSITTQRTYSRQQPSITTQRSYTRDGRDWDRDRDRDWDGDRDWSHRRHLSYDVYRNWDRGRVYSWNNNRYHWYNGAWVIYGASPTVVYTDSLPAVGASLVASVQAELLDRGYNPGPADGVMGSRTRSAIAEFQDDRGLAVTGTINRSLLRELDLD